MSDITGRIEDVLYRETHLTYVDASRVAAAVVDELGLREEEGADFTFGGQTRYVTPWVDDVPLT